MNGEHIWSEYAAAYALGALDAEERAAFEAHLTDCPACRAEVRAYEESVGALGYSAPVQAPPADLKQRVLAEARASRPITFAPTLRKRPPLAWFVAAASLVIALGSLALYTRERARRELAEEDGAAAASQLLAQRVEAARKDSLLAAVLAPDVQSTNLVAQGQPPSVRLYLSRARNVVVLAAHDLRPAPAGRTYQLWGIAGGQPVSLGTFNTQADGTATLALTLPRDARFELSAVTEEPAGGSPAPTTTPFIAGAWSAASR